MRALAVLFLMLWAAPLTAEELPAAEEAALRLTEAAALLESAEGASDRIGALTATVRAYEAGLSAMREGLVSVALRQRSIEAALLAEDAQLAEFLALLQTVSRRGDARALAHPGSALETIQAGMLVSTVVPDLEARAAALEARYLELADLNALLRAGIATLEDGVRGAREARLQLADALTNRTDLPPRQALDEAATEALLNSTETLAAFADALVSKDIEPTSIEPGSWASPVKGEMTLAFGTPDSAGVVRPGLIFAVPNEALVVAPADAGVRFSGPVPGQGIVVILEPRAGYLVILSGLERSFARQGQIVAMGEPIGLMGGKLANAQENLNELLRNGSLLGRETLYMEVRQGLSPIDPASLLVLGDA